MFHLYFSFRQDLFCLLSAGLFGLGCATFYKPVPADSGTPENSIKILTGQTTKKYFILRQGAYNYAMKDIHVDSDSITLMAILSPVDSTHTKYIHASMFHNKFKSTDNLVLQEIEGSPDRSFLRKFKTPDELAWYSLNQYRSVLNPKAAAAASHQ